MTVHARVLFEPETCRVLEAAADSVSITQQIAEDRCGWMHCHTVLTEQNGDAFETEYLSGPIEQDCLSCVMVQKSSCITTMDRIKNDSFVVSIVSPDKKDIRTLVEHLDEHASVSLQSIGSTEEVLDTQLRIDLEDISPKRLEALEVALDAGYYDSPRQADLAEVADRLGVTKSAASQRLNGLERLLVKTLSAPESPQAETV